MYSSLQQYRVIWNNVRKNSYQGMTRYVFPDERYFLFKLFGSPTHPSLLSETKTQQLSKRWDIVPLGPTMHIDIC